MDRYRTRLAIRRDEIAGFWPGVAFAVGLGGIAGATTVVIFTGWTWLIPDSDGVAVVATEAGGWSGGWLGLAGWWAALWLGLSLGLLVGLWTGYRAWHTGARIQHRRRIERAHARARREALLEAQAILDVEAAPDVRGP